MRPRRYDRAAIRLVLEIKGRDEALREWPRSVVDPIARIMGLIPRWNEYAHSWNPDWTPLLGTRPDTETASQLGISIATVSAYRRKLGILRYSAKERIAQRLALLRTIPDDALAGPLNALSEKYALSYMDLHRERKRRQITAKSARGRTVSGPENNANLRRVAALAMIAAYPDATLAQIGAVIGCTRERVRQYIYESKAVAS